MSIGKVKKSAFEKAFDIANFIIMIFIGIITLYPFWYTFVLSISTVVESIKPGLHLIPAEITTAAYKSVFMNANIYIGYKNTVIRTVAGTVLSVLLTSMLAYALSRKHMPFARIFTLLVTLTMFFDSGIVPNYLLIRNLGLIDNLLVYILPSAISAYNVVIARSYFLSIPQSLIEAAKIDGANEIGIFYKIILPISKPMIATIGLWVAVGHWNTWMDGLLYINDNSKQILQIFLQRIISYNEMNALLGGANADVSSFTPETIKSATIVVTILPILMVYPFIQKYFVKGIMVGAVKG